MKIKKQNKNNKSININKILLLSKVIPVVMVSNVDEGLSIAEALLNGGIKVMEITLRSDTAFKTVEKVINKIPQMTVGVGTVISPAQLIESSAIGAHFAVSPGCNKALFEIAKDIHDNLPYMPGIANPSQIMSCLNHGFSTMKFFPAECFGGTDFLNNMQYVFKEAKFCPTGGINFDNAFNYLNLPNVLSIGGSFVIPKEVVENKEWNLITTISKKIMRNLS